MGQCCLIFFLCCCCLYVCVYAWVLCTAFGFGFGFSFGEYWIVRWQSQKERKWQTAPKLNHMWAETEPIKKLSGMKFYDWPEHEWHAQIPGFVIPIIIVNILALEQANISLRKCANWVTRNNLYVCIWPKLLWVCVCVCVLSHLSLPSTSANIITLYIYIYIDVYFQWSRRVQEWNHNTSTPVHPMYGKKCSISNINNPNNTTVF